MCELSEIVPSIMIAAGGIFAAIISVGIAIVLNNGFFSAPGAPAPMIAAGISCGVAIGGLVAATIFINDYNECMNSPEACAGHLTNVLATINALKVVLGIMATACLATAISAWVPWIGAVPMYPIIACLVIQLPLFASIYAFLSDLIVCLQKEEARANAATLIVGSIIIGIAVASTTGLVRRRVIAKKKDDNDS